MSTRRVLIVFAPRASSWGAKGGVCGAENLTVGQTQDQNELLPPCRFSWSRRAEGGVYGDRLLDRGLSSADLTGGLSRARSRGAALGWAQSLVAPMRHIIKRGLAQRGNQPVALA